CHATGPFPRFSDLPGHRAGEREDESHRFVPTTGNRLKPQRTSAGNDLDVGSVPNLSGRVETLPPPTGQCIQTCLIPSTAHSRRVASALSGLVPMTTAETPPGNDFKSPLGIPGHAGDRDPLVVQELGSSFVDRSRYLSCLQLRPLLSQRSGERAGSSSDARSDG